MPEKPNVDEAAREAIEDLRTRQGTLEKERIAAFIECQDGVIGKVVIGELERPDMGASSGGLIFRAELDEGKGRHIRDFVLRCRPPERGVFHEYDLPGQFQILKALEETDVPVPKALWLDPTGETLGLPGFVMEKVEGVVPPQAPLAGGVIAEASPDERESMIYDVIRTLGKIHSVDWGSAGLHFLEKRGKGTSPIERDINWYWDSLCWGTPDEAKTLESVRQRLLDSKPSEGDIVLNHGDANLGNYMFQNNRVAAVLDWEMACLCSPEVDLAYLLHSFECLSQGLPRLPGIPTAEECKKEYERVSGRSISNWGYYSTMVVYRMYILLLMGSKDLPEEIRKSFEVFFNYCRERF